MIQLLGKCWEQLQRVELWLDVYEPDNEAFEYCGNVTNPMMTNMFRMSAFDQDFPGLIQQPGDLDQESAEGGGVLRYRPRIEKENSWIAMSAEEVNFNCKQMKLL